MSTKNIELELIKKYSALRDVRVVNYCYDYSDLTKRLGKAASKIFEDLIEKQDNPKVGIGGGNTLYNTIEALKYRPRKIRIFPTAIIGRGPEIRHIDSTFLATLLYFKSRPLAKGFVVDIPPLPSKREIATKFIDNLVDCVDELKWVMNSMQSVDIALVGLGAVIPTGDFDDELSKLGVTARALGGKGVVGGINYNWFTKDGSQFGDYFLTISVENLKALAKEEDKYVLLVAGGRHKINSLQTAISCGMANILVTDSYSAKYLAGINL